MVLGPPTDRPTMAPAAIYEVEAGDLTSNHKVNNVADVCIVGAGPGGLMLADNLARFGIKAYILDERPDRTTAGRADGLQPKTIETLRMLRLADDLLRVGNKVYDISIWAHGSDNCLKRRGREIHYPEGSVDVMDPYMLLCHQGMVEAIFLRAMRERGVQVQRSTSFETYSPAEDGEVLDIKVKKDGMERTLQARYLVGCDGAHSNVRKAIPGVTAEGSSSESVWGVLDGAVRSNFPDIWSKTIVVHPRYGAILIIPRERGMTRFYIELKAEGSPDGVDLDNINEKVIMRRAQLICAPFQLEWTSLEWSGRYQIGQRVCNKFADDELRAFISGDASHTHSPKAAQGMNTSIHDSWNLGWKLNLALRGLTSPDNALLATYEQERRKIAQDLISFDYDHANQIAGGDSEALAENFRTNMGFMSGVGVTYSDNALNHGVSDSITFPHGVIRPGHILPMAKAIRYVDHNPVHVQLDIPILGQFRIYFLVRDVAAPEALYFLHEFSEHIRQPQSPIARLSRAAAKSYALKPRLQSTEDMYFRHERYTAVSDIFTPALITESSKNDFEISVLPPLFSTSPWTIYLDDTDSYGGQNNVSCISKWLGDLAYGEIAILNVRPDNYVGSVSRWDASGHDAQGMRAAEWLMSYYDGFLKA